MVFADTKKLLQRAQHGKYAVGHFNINNMEIVQGVVNAGVKLKSPLILATSEGALKYAGMNFLHDLAQTAAKLVDIPIALHLDHGQNLETIKKAIACGYSSVMIDASPEKFEKNVALTKKIVALAHRKGVAVEAELGTIGGAEDAIRSRSIVYTDPAKAAEFVERTGCDFLAVAIGTSHGAYKFSGKAELRHDIVQRVRQQVKIPLVLHGGSCVPSSFVRLAEKHGADLAGVHGVPDAQIKTAIKNGICKINTDTDLRIAFDAGVRKVIQEQPRAFDPRQILGPARMMVEKIVAHRLKLFGSNGKS